MTKQDFLFLSLVRHCSYSDGVVISRAIFLFCTKCSVYVVELFKISFMPAEVSHITQNFLEPYMTQPWKLISISFIFKVRKLSSFKHIAFLECYHGSVVMNRKHSPRYAKNWKQNYIDMWMLIVEFMINFLFFASHDILI